jgi:hypothetical protein
VLRCGSSTRAGTTKLLYKPSLKPSFFQLVPLLRCRADAVLCGALYFHLFPSLVVNFVFLIFFSVSTSYFNWVPTSVFQVAPLLRCCADAVLCEAVCFHIFPSLGVDFVFLIFFLHYVSILFFHLFLSVFPPPLVVRTSLIPRHVHLKQSS